MCGIAGFWTKQAGVEIENAICGMTNKIKHRGPDDKGFWFDEISGIVLGHRRLSILDLSPAGHQPMISSSGRYVLVYNGEIYNHIELLNLIKAKEKGRSIYFKGTSDTEVILAAVEVFGLYDALQKFVGMFAFALYDRDARILHLVRDRLGEKPLYYGFVGSAFVFASELKAIKAFPGFNNEINRDALAQFFRHNYIPAPYSIYNGIFKLCPGTMVSIKDINCSLPKPETYWSALEAVKKGIQHQFLGSESEALAYLEELILQSIKGQMISDVPLGAFLSGGIDSSVVVAIMQSQSINPIKTFTIGFNEKGYNEAEEAKKVARHLGTNHTELYINPREAMEVIPLLPDLYDEPFSDSSQIPTFLVSKLAKKHVTVCLSGDGGDELFGGYNRYFQTKKIWSSIRWIPCNIRKLLARMAKGISPGIWDVLFNMVTLPMPSGFKNKPYGDKIHKFSDIFASSNLKGIYYGFVTHWKNERELVVNSSFLPTIFNSNYNESFFSDQRELMMYLDLVTYLPDDILVKVDRAAMGVSLETRVPLIDHRIVEFAWSLPLAMKFRNGVGKWALRQILYKYVPKELIDRPKMGFGVPIGEWIRGPLREWAEGLLDENRINEEGYLNSSLIQKKWREHLNGTYNWQYYLWDVLIFQSWLEKQKKV